MKWLFINMWYLSTGDSLIKPVAVAVKENVRILEMGNSLYIGTWKSMKTKVTLPPSKPVIPRD